MQRLGFIHDMMDVKILVLFVTARSNYPLTSQEIYELCYQDECLSYFDVCTAIPEMVESGHLQPVGEDTFTVTEKGRQDGETTQDSLPFTVRRAAEDAVNGFNRQNRRSSFVKTNVQAQDGAEYQVTVSLDDEQGNLMRLSLTAPDSRQAVRLSRLLEEKADDVYKMVMTVLLDDEDE